MRLRCRITALRDGKPARRLLACVTLIGVAWLAACDTTELIYLPTTAGHWWVYDIQSTILDESQHQRYIARNVGARTLNKETFLAQRQQQASIVYLQHSDSGLQQLARRAPDADGTQQETPARTLLPVAREVGSAWSVSSSLGLIESRTFAPADRIISRRYSLQLHKTIAATEQSVEVAAGRFSDCLLVEGHGQLVVPTDRRNAYSEVTVHTREWFAPGVGLVLLTREETSSSAFLKPGRQRWELIDYGN